MKPKFLKTISKNDKKARGAAPHPGAQQKHVNFDMALGAENALKRYKEKYGVLIESIGDELKFIITWKKAFAGIGEASDIKGTIAEDAYFLGRKAGNVYRNKKNLEKQKKRLYDWSQAEQLKLPMKLVKCAKKIVKKVKKKAEVQKEFSFIEQLSFAFKFVGVAAYEYAKKIKKGEKLPRGKAFKMYTFCTH